MLETVKPKEQAGRDSFGRFKAQSRSAAIATLSILEGSNNVDRVYCDLHDDFVVRINNNGVYSYVFYQVKTHGKQKHNWTLNEVFGLSSRVKDLSKHKSEKIRDSFAGKLLLHTVNFRNHCEAVVFQTNINIDDPLEDLLDDIREGKFENKLSVLLAERFCDCFFTESLAVSVVHKNIQKLRFETDVQYLKLASHNFGPIAKDIIYKYSEIDLSHDESEDILTKLVELVELKSSGVIDDWTRESIELNAGISISDLLEVLSISRAAYEILAGGGDLLAIKNASIIQRTLQNSGASEEIIEFCTRCKIKWDEWFRNNRHTLSEFDVVSVKSDVAMILQQSINKGAVNISFLQGPIEDYLKKIDNKNYGLDKEKILGGVFSELVRMKQ